MRTFVWIAFVAILVAAALFTGTQHGNQPAAYDPSEQCSQVACP